MADNGLPALRPAHDILVNLRVVVRATRRYQGLTLRALGILTGVPFTSLSRFERGGDMYLTSAVKILAWLARQPAGAVRVESHDGEGDGSAAGKDRG